MLSVDEGNLPAFIYPKLTIETLEQGVNFEHISHLALMFLLLTLNMKLPAGLLITQPPFTCSKFTIETIEQRVKYVQS